MEQNLRYRLFVTSVEADEELGIEADDDILFIGDTVTGLLMWFDNVNEWWDKSIYKLNDIVNDNDFTEVGKDWDNGYVSATDAIEYMNKKLDYDPEQGQSLSLNKK